MNRLFKTFILSCIFVISTVTFTGEPGPRTFTITNNTSNNAQIYLSAKGWAQIGKGSAGNLAVSQQGVIDPEGLYRTLAPGQSTTYQWTDMRIGFCIQSLMVKFDGDEGFGKAKVVVQTFAGLSDVDTKNKNKANNAGCANQNISITRDADGFYATFNYTKPVDPVDEPTPLPLPEPNQPAALPLAPNDPNQPVSKDSILQKIDAQKGN